MNTRTEFLEIARVICAFNIVMVHCTYHSQFIGDLSLQCSNALFFFLSGYFMINKGMKGNFIRFTHIFIPFVVWEMLAVYFIYDQISPVFFKSTFLYSPFNGPLWFLRNLCVLFALAPLFFRIKALQLPLAICFILFTFSPRLSEDLPFFEQNYSNITSYFYAAGYFLLGMGLQDIKLPTLTHFFETQWQNIARIFISAVIITILFSGHFTAYDIGIITLPLVKICGVCGILAISMAISLHAKGLARAIMYISPACFFVFAAHGIIEIKYSYYVYEYFYNTIENGTIRYTITLLSSFALSVFLSFIGILLIKMLRRIAPQLLPYTMCIRK